MYDPDRWSNKRHFSTLGKLMRQALGQYVRLQEWHVDGAKIGVILVDREFFARLEKRLEELLKPVIAGKTA